MLRIFLVFGFAFVALHARTLMQERHPSDALAIAQNAEEEPGHYTVLSATETVDNVLARGADSSGAHDSTVSLLASISTGKTVYVPQGTFHIKDVLTLANGQCLVGDGRAISVLHISDDFNPHAPAVIQAGDWEPGGCLRDVGIVFDQPSDQG